MECRQNKEHPELARVDSDASTIPKNDLHQISKKVN